MKRIRRPTLVFLLVPAIGFILAFLPTPAGAATHYELVEGSGYVEGCFEPCMCPIFMNETLTGGFDLSPGPVGGFELSDIDWSFRRGDSIVQVTGSGTFRIEGELQRLELDLTVGDEGARHFDSGWVAWEAEFPRMEVAAAVNGFFCYDYVFVVHAVSGPVEFERSTWGTIKAIYR